MIRDDIRLLLPQRERMLLVDEAECHQMQRATGCYTVRGDEWFLQGHFPGNPVVPGVILCEILAQTCCVLFAPQVSGKTPYYTGLDAVKFRRKVLPGDTIEVECSLIKQKGPFCFISGKGTVNGELAVSAKFSFALID